MKELLVGVGVVALLGAGGFALAEYGYRLNTRYAPRYEDLRRETYEHSRAYREGVVRDLENLQLEWATGTPAQRAAIRSVALHRLADVPDDALTPSLQAFAIQLRSPEQ